MVRLILFILRWPFALAFVLLATAVFFIAAIFTLDIRYVHECWGEEVKDLLLTGWKE